MSDKTLVQLYMDVFNMPWADDGKTKTWQMLLKIDDAIGLINHYISMIHLSNDIAGSLAPIYLMKKHFYLRSDSYIDHEGKIVRVLGFNSEGFGYSIYKLKLSIEELEQKIACNRS